MSTITCSTQRKSTFAKRQKYFIRNFLTEQLSSNQFLLPETKNPLSKNLLHIKPKTANNNTFYRNSRKNYADNVFNELKYGSEPDKNHYQKEYNIRLV
jgi:hypothetical protein